MYQYVSSSHSISIFTFWVLFLRSVYNKPMLWIVHANEGSMVRCTEINLWRGPHVCSLWCPRALISWAWIWPTLLSYQFHDYKACLFSLLFHIYVLLLFLSTSQCSRLFHPNEVNLHKGPHVCSLWCPQSLILWAWSWPMLVSVLHSSQNHFVYVMHHATSVKKCSVLIMWITIKNVTI